MYQISVKLGAVNSNEKLSLMIPKVIKLARLAQFRKTMAPKNRSILKATPFSRNYLF